uniref:BRASSINOSTEROID INSENSITIVE 1-associated receptor kinase 1-like protein n=1 Tax=Sedum alfredii TaxID=439688 RepID=A0A410N650_9MAGN|nr:BRASSINOSTEROID INSENSITIVE 1-associated receptor kinase 1-like protein [Sedum alfredii]
MFVSRHQRWYVGLFVLLNLSLYSSSLNHEGLALLKLRERIVDDPLDALSSWIDNGGDASHCIWNGVQCSHGYVVALDLKNLCLGGTLAPELGQLTRIKSIILRYNSFYGNVPQELGELKELEVLDLGYNNFSGSLPHNIGINPYLAILLLDNNNDLSILTKQAQDLSMISEFHVDEKRTSYTSQGSFSRRSLKSWSVAQTVNSVYRQVMSPSATTDVSISVPPPSFAPSGSPTYSPSPSPSPAQSPLPFPSPLPSVPTFPAPSPPIPTSSRDINKSKRVALIALLSVASGIFLVSAIVGIFIWQSKKGHIVKPWVTGLSGQLRKAFVTGVPNLKRSELELACEDFSNVVGSSVIGNVYKGTLSNGEEIAVTSVSVKSASDWSAYLETQFRRTIDTLSKVNHKNFVNLVGFCEEEEPFTRMLVYEYAPNGTLFEHLHIKEAEHLDWKMRLRVAMGMAYCLEHLHQLRPPVTHKNLNSSAINLTEDYAAKISYFPIWNEAASNTTDSSSMELSSTSTQTNVYSFGVTLFEMITGTLPYSANKGSLDDWASDYLTGLDKPLKGTVDPTLTSFDEVQLEAIQRVIKSCVHPDPKKRPTMAEISVTMRQITAIGPDQAIPRLSPLWWAELEIMSAEGA